MSIDEPVWVPTVFTKNRDRLLTTDMSKKLMTAILAHEKVAPLLSDDHFSVDGTLVEAWASFKSFKPKAAASGDRPPADPPPPDTASTGGNSAAGTAAEAKDGASEMATTDTTAKAQIGRNIERNWRGQAWSNATHASVTDPDARLYRKAKGRPAQLCYMGHALMENRNGFAVGAHLTHADGTAERRAAIDLLDAHDPGSTRQITLGADKGYDAAEFVADLRRMCVTPHIRPRPRARPSTLGPHGMRATR